MRYFLGHRLAMIGSDGTAVSPDGPWGATSPHPRFYGCDPRVLGRYVRELVVLTLEDAVHKMTGAVAERGDIPWTASSPTASRWRRSQAYDAAHTRAHDCIRVAVEPA